MWQDPRFIVTLAAIGAAVVYDLAITFIHPVLDKELMSVILTALNGNGLITAITYWLGSSQGSTAKNDVIKDLHEQLRNRPPHEI